MRAGTPNIVLINRSIVSPVAITDRPQMDQLSSDIADNVNAEKLPIVPTTSFTKPSVLVPVQHSAGRPHCWAATAFKSSGCGRRYARLTSITPHIVVQGAERAVAFTAMPWAARR